MDYNFEFFDSQFTDVPAEVELVSLSNGTSDAFVRRGIEPVEIRGFEGVEGEQASATMWAAEELRFNTTESYGDIESKYDDIWKSYDDSLVTDKDKISRLEALVEKLSAKLEEVQRDGSD